MKITLTCLVVLISFMMLPVNAISYNSDGTPKQFIEIVSDNKCENGLWVGYVINDNGVKLSNISISLYDSSKQVVKRNIAEYPDGTIKLYPDGKDRSYSKIELVKITSTGYEDLWFTPECFTIPEWVKNTASWWSIDAITDADFISMIQFLIKNELIIISEISDVPDNDTTIPTWIKSSAGWWADGIISDNEFLKNIEFLVSNGVIILEIEKEDVVVEIVECHQDEIPSRIKVSLSATSQIDKQVDVEYVVHALDKNLEILTVEIGYIFDLKPHSTQYDIRYMNYVDSFEHCGISINTINDYSLP